MEETYTLTCKFKDTENKFKLIHNDRGIKDHGRNIHMNL